MQAVARATLQEAKEAQEQELSTVRELLADTTKYELEEILAQGGQGTSVLLHRDGKKYVGRIARREEFPSSWREDRKKIIEGTRVLQSLDHPGIAPLEELVEARDWLMSVRGYVPGETLSTRIQRLGAISEEEAVRIGVELLEILTYLEDKSQHRNSQKVVHGDIKPSNIIVRKDGSIGLIDFGIARTQLEDNTTCTFLGGSFNYAPLERFGGIVDTRSDQYSTAVTLLEALYGSIPPEFQERKFVGVEYTVPEDLPFGLRRVLSRMLRRDYTERYESARVALKELSLAGHTNGPFSFYWNLLRPRRAASATRQLETSQVKSGNELAEQSYEPVVEQEIEESGEAVVEVEMEQEKLVEPPFEIPSLAKLVAQFTQLKTDFEKAREQPGTYHEGSGMTEITVPRFEALPAYTNFDLSGYAALRKRGLSLASPPGVQKSIRIRFEGLWGTLTQEHIDGWYFKQFFRGLPELENEIYPKVIAIREKYLSSFFSEFNSRNSRECSAPVGSVWGVIGAEYKDLKAEGMYPGRRDRASRSETYLARVRREYLARTPCYLRLLGHFRDVPSSRNKTNDELWKDAKKNAFRSLTGQELSSLSSPPAGERLDLASQIERMPEFGRLERVYDAAYQSGAFGDITIQYDPKTRVVSGLFAMVKGVPGIEQNPIDLLKFLRDKKT